MEGTFFGQQDSLKSLPAITARVVTDAKRTFGTVADEEFIERCARDAVEELWRDSVKVTSFVPVLALRRVREEVDALESGLVGAGRESS